MNSISKILACAILLSSAVYSAAQDAQEKKGKTYRATLFGKWEGPELFTKEKKAYLPLEPAKNSYTQPFRYRENVIVLYKKGVSEDGKEINVVALNVIVPPTILEPLMILVWDKNRQRPTAKVIEFSSIRFRYGTYQIVNFGKLPLAGHIGAKTNKIICMPGKEYIASLDLKNGEAAPIVFYARINNRPQKVFGSITIHRNRKRAIYLMYPERNKLGRLVFQTSVIVDTARKANQ